MTVVDPLRIYRFEWDHDRQLVAIVVADGTESDAFAYPDAACPSAEWARRVPVQVVAR